jgi:hypothetical protein
MPLDCWRSRPPGCPPRLGGRRPRRRLFLPPPPEGRPGPTFIFFSFCRSAFSPPEGGLDCFALYYRWVLPARRTPNMRRNPLRLEKSLVNYLFCPSGAWSQLGAEGQLGSVAVGNNLNGTPARRRTQGLTRIVLHRSNSQCLGSRDVTNCSRPTCPSASTQPALTCRAHCIADQ